MYLGSKMDEIDAGAYVIVTVSDTEGNYDVSRTIDLHPYESFDPGKVVHCRIPDSFAATTVSAAVPINDRMVTLKFDSGCVRINCSLTIVGTFSDFEIY